MNPSAIEIVSQTGFVRGQVEQPAQDVLGRVVIEGVYRGDDSQNISSMRRKVKYRIKIGIALGSIAFGISGGATFVLHLVHALYWLHYVSWVMLGALTAGGIVLIINAEWERLTSKLFKQQSWQPKGGVLS